MKPDLESSFRFTQTKQSKTDGIFLFAVICLIFSLTTRANADPLDNWQVQQLGTDILTGVTYGNGTYVIVGQTNGKIYTSPDASIWIDRSYDTHSNSYCVTFANGAFAAGGTYKLPDGSAYYGGVQSSTDGVNWSTTGIAFYSNALYGITFTNNEFFAPGNQMSVLTSSDGYAWAGGNANFSGPMDVYGVAYGNGIYVAVGTVLIDSSNLWASSSPPSSGLPSPVNGNNFRNSGTSNTLYGVAYGNSTFVAIGAGGTIITSPDGITWASRTSGTTNTLYGICFANGVFATAGDGGTILTSQDGVAWTSRASGTINLLRGIAFANNRFIAVGVDGTVTISGSVASNSGAVANISTRSFVQTGDNVMIAGIIIEGGNKRIIVRAIGPSLTQYGITNALADPKLELHDSTHAIAWNDNWQTTEIGGIITADQVSAIQNSGHAPGDPRESAIIATLAPGNYTAIVQGVNATVGVGLVEVYALP